MDPLEGGGRGSTHLQVEAGRKGGRARGASRARTALPPVRRREKREPLPIQPRPGVRDLRGLLRFHSSTETRHGRTQTTPTPVPHRRLHGGHDRSRLGPPPTRTGGGAGSGAAPPAAVDPRGGDAPADTFHLPEVVVTATGEATPRALLPQSVTVLDGADLRSRGVTFLLEALQEVRGPRWCAPAPSGGPPRSSSGGELQLREGDAGRGPPERARGPLRFRQLHPGEHRAHRGGAGPSSVLYGSDAVSGVIHLFTREGGDGEGSGALRRPPGRLPGDLVGRGGGPGRIGPSSWSLALGRTDSDGFYPVNNRFTALVGSGRLALRPDDRSRVALVPPGPGVPLPLSHRWERGDRRPEPVHLRRRGDPLPGGNPSDGGALEGASSSGPVRRSGASRTSPTPRRTPWASATGDTAWGTPSAAVPTPA
jgi:hypothetical protein